MQSRSRDAFTQRTPDTALLRSAVHKQRRWPRASNICTHFGAFLLATRLPTAPESGLRPFAMPAKSYVLGNLPEREAAYVSNKWNTEQVPQTENKPSVLASQANESPSLKLYTSSVVRHLQTWCSCCLKNTGTYCLCVAVASGLSTCSREEFSGSNLSPIWAAMVLWISKKHPITKISVSLNCHTSSKMFVVLSRSESSLLYTLESCNNWVVHTLIRDRSDAGGEADLWGTHGNATFAESQAVRRVSSANFPHGYILLNDGSCWSVQEAGSSSSRTASNCVPFLHFSLCQDVWKECRNGENRQLCFLLFVTLAVV